jgi:50S ribosomal subunit-associated GTPase HflX
MCFSCRAYSCDLLVVVIDASQLSFQEKLSDQVEKHLANLFPIHTAAVTKLIVLNKIDLIKTKIDWKPHPNQIPISCLAGVNIDEFLSKLKQTIAEKYLFTPDSHITDLR